MCGRRATARDQGGRELSEPIGLLCRLLRGATATLILSQSAIRLFGEGAEGQPSRDESREEGRLPPAAEGEERARLDDDVIDGNGRQQQRERPGSHPAIPGAARDTQREQGRGRKGSSQPGEEDFGAERERGSADRKCVGERSGNGNEFTQV